jgi:hypothetical protein
MKCEQSQYTFNLFASAQTLKMWYLYWELQHQIILKHAWKMWTLQISLNGMDLKNMDTQSQSISVTHLNNSNFENADTLIRSTPWQKSGMSESTFQTSALLRLGKCGHYKLEHTSPLFKLFIQFLTF